MLSGSMVLFPENPVVSEQQASAVLFPGCGPAKGICSRFCKDSFKKSKGKGCRVQWPWHHLAKKHDLKQFPIPTGPCVLINPGNAEGVLGRHH